jgi:hypothetical protein
MYPENQDTEFISRARVRHINSGKSKAKKKEKLVVNKSRKSCEDKRRFRSIDEAKRGLQASRNRARIDITETGATRLRALRYYVCPKCSGYHLTSKPEITFGKAA